MSSGAVLNSDGQKKLAQLRAGAAANPNGNAYVQPVPPLPPAVKQRFPELHKWEADMQEWANKLTTSIRGTTKT